MGSLASDSRPHGQPSLNMVDADTVKKICDIYDWDGKGELDLFYLGDIMYAMGYNTTKKVCVGLGQTDEEGKKFAKFDDVVSKVEEALKTPDSQGTYADYVELLKLYDKNQNGTMMLAELDNILCNLGDEIPKEDVQKMFAEICDPEDEGKIRRAASPPGGRTTRGCATQPQTPTPAHPDKLFASAFLLGSPLLPPLPPAALLSQHHSHFLASPVGYLYERGDR